ncbi:hypothetical protein GCM10010914_30250 [Deinococcus wulumuqiensis]|uniref:Uncharacterized protein n=1 Tax=Deinococcus wulumuqiensis TaxID=980427 RepID=A0AAV4KC67_9DEIO|nr:hypothetical protein GCM10010914_30250 [Deinococcus wulumuqiensis]GGP31275.1 hypothetical protein GCM10008021_29260 [Deinococcus wulumuqiensis]
MYFMDFPPEMSKGRGSKGLSKAKWPRTKKKAGARRLPGFEDSTGAEMMDDGFAYADGKGRSGRRAEQGRVL